MKKKKIRSFLLGFVSLSLIVSPLLGQTNPAQEKAMARRAALVDGYRTLSEIIHGIHIDAETQVEDFITTNDAIKGKLEGFIQAAEVIDEQYSDKIYRVTMRIDVEKLEMKIGKDLDYEGSSIKVVGKGAASTDKKTHQKPEMEEPKEDWHKKTIKAKGYGAQPSDSSMSEAQKKLNAERAAKMDAYRNLIERIKGVNVDSKTTIQDFITLDDTIETNIKAFVKGARVVETRHLKDGRTKVILEIDLKPLKAIIE